MFKYYFLIKKISQIENYPCLSQLAEEQERLQDLMNIQELESQDSEEYQVRQAFSLTKHGLYIS